MRRNGHSLMELLVVVAVFGLLAAVAIPRLRFRVVDQRKVDAAVHKLIADLQRTQSLALRDAATNNTGYTLRMPPPSPHTEYYIRDVHNWVIVYEADIDPSITVTTGHLERFRFTPFGDMDEGFNSHIDLSGDGKSYRITFVKATGQVICTEL